MPPKKRKASVSSSVADPSREDSNMSLPSPVNTPKRRKRAQNFDPSVICQELYDTIRNHKDESGRLLCEAFIRVPKRRSEPEYYDLVTRPIDLLKIQHKLKNDEYEDIDALTEDVETLVNNAKLYYAPSSQEYNDACELWELYEETKGVLLTGVFGQDVQPHSTDSNDGPEMQVQESVDESGDNETLMQAYAEANTVKEESGHAMSMRGRQRTDYVSLSGIQRARTQGNDSAQKVTKRRNSGSQCTDPGAKAIKQELIEEQAVTKDTSRSKRELSRAELSKKSEQKEPKRSTRIKNIDSKEALDTVDQISDQPKKASIDLKGKRTSAVERTISDSKAVRPQRGSKSVSSSNESKDKQETVSKAAKESKVNTSDSKTGKSQKSKEAIDFTHKDQANVSKILNYLNEKDLKDKTPKPIAKNVKDNVLETIKIKSKSLKKPVKAETKKDFRTPGKACSKKETQGKSEPPKKPREHVWNLTDLKRKMVESMGENPNKRRRLSTVSTGEDPEASVAGAEDAGSEAGGDDSWMFEELFAAIVSAHDGTGRNISDIFKLMPSKSVGGKYRDYYDVIKHPIDLKVIAIKIQQNSYTSLPDMFSDVMLLVANAKTFNEPGSQIYKDALAIKKIAMSKKAELEQPRSKRGRPKKPMPTLRMSSMFAQLEYESDSGSAPSPPTTHLVQQQQQQQQNTPAPAAQPAAPAPAPEPVPQVVSLLDDEESNPVPPAPSGQVEELMEGLEDENTTMGEEADTDNPLWQMYHAVKNYKNCFGQRLSEPFIRLPNRRIYPDYYEEIRRPMSFLKIQKKIKLGRYKDLNMLCNDMELMFDNAKQYNIEESKIYKDSVKLSQVMHAKRKEVLTGERDEILDSDFKNKNKRVGESSEERKRPGRRPLAPEDLAKKRAQALHRLLMEYQVDGRHPIDIFLTLPSKKDYPDYYQVITDPIDMEMIEQNIKDGKYTTEQVAINDFLKLFNNAKIYNEETSQVFRDAVVLERLLKTKIRNFGQSVVMTDPLSPKLGRSSSYSDFCLSMMYTCYNTPKRSLQYGSPLDQKLNELYNSIKDHADPRGRMLSTPFIKLPLKVEYPDYYEIIKKPMDMATIHQRVVASKYQTLEDMVADFVLMFDNACKYNEPDSLIYKDALTLQRVCLEKKQELSADDDDNVPDVPALVQELMVNLFISTHNCTDEEGRCYSDSFMELPPPPKKEEAMETNQSDSLEKKHLTFERVKWNLDRGRYVRLDRFQEDMFEVFEYARSVSRSDSQLYEDAVELQLYFIRKRDELCKKGEILVSPALSYMDQHLMQVVEVEKKEKQAVESQQDEEAKANGGTETPADTRADDDTEDSFIYKEQTFSVGDFVYIEPRESGSEPHIVSIEKLWKDEKDGEMWLRGNWFLRPKETYHQATKKFLEKEVFKSDFCDSVPFSKMVGKCFVMSVKEYYKYSPEGFADKDVYVCESRYSGRHKAFKKIKLWLVPRNDSVKLHLREAPLIPTRVASVYAESSSDPSFDTSSLAPLDKEREVVLIENMNVSEDGIGGAGCKYYEQYQAPHGWIKLGDCVYIKPQGANVVESSDSKPLICRIDKIWTDASGEAFIHGPYYVQPSEVEHQPTRLFYVRELFKSSVEETARASSIVARCVVMPYKDFIACRITELAEEHVYVCEAKYNHMDKSIKKFMKPVSMIRNNNLSIKVCDDEIYFFKKPITPKKEPSPLLLRASQFGGTGDGGDSNMSASLDLDESSQMSGMTDPFDGNESRDTATPTSTRKRPSQVKQKNKVRPASGYILYAAEFRKSVQQQNQDMGFGEISRLVGQRWRDLPKEEKQLYEDRAKRIADEQAAKQEEAERAFNLSLQKYPPASASPGQDPNKQGQQGQQYTNGNQQGPHMGPPPPPPRPASPMFVAVPARTQRLLHSEAYLRYIENLKPESTSVSNWEKQLTATQENTPVPSSSKLPVNWLANGAGHHQTTTAALWALRDVMMRDALTVSRTLDWNEM